VTQAKPRDHTRVSVRVDRDARVGQRRYIEVPRNKLIVENHTATARNAIILSEREERETTYLNLTVVIPPFNPPALSLSHRDKHVES
jgi:hypothetical protein